MRSYANIKGHPIHPALIPFPLAFLLGAALFDIAGSIWDGEPWMRTGLYLTVLGLVAGVAAAIPGILDFVNTVPPRSSGRSRALRHGLTNTTGLLCFAIALFLKRRNVPSTGVVVLETIGAAALIYGSWLGGVLVTRNMISVEHRYAGAGKWKEETVSSPPGHRVLVARSDDLESDQMKLLHINGRRVVLARTRNGFHAFDDGCTHRGGSLADGVCIDGTVQCLWHGSQFDVATGNVRCGPAKAKIRVYALEQKNNEVWLAAAPDGREVSKPPRSG
jgi:nitrite reductase/ring-hydroxylating ferredoxin subunit/uncharacterized membrane protein